ncbi:MAG TPA: RDD family protein [Solirubrobacteraceae bacterium]|nr:RDD family protein [Solirubrobacteraceae bacterium]
MIQTDRKRLDSRRVGAVVLDILLLAPIELLAFRYERGVQVLATALFLVYFYLSDTTSGQTVGKSVFKLRTVTLDGRIVSGRAAATRTVLRIVDHTFIGLIVMVCTGQRRQRLGDLAAKTAVVDAREVVVGRPLDRSMLLYPAIWLVPALVVFTLTVQGRFPGSYRMTADAICEEADAIAPRVGNPLQLVHLLEAETDELERIDAPPHWRDRHDVLVAEYRDFTQRTERVVHRLAQRRASPAQWQSAWARLGRRSKRVNARLSRLGYEGCAGSASAA